MLTGEKHCWKDADGGENIVGRVLTGENIVGRMLTGESIVGRMLTGGKTLLEGC